MLRPKYLAETLFNCCLVVLTYASASAADLATVTPLPSIMSPQDSWTGFYVGVGGGVSSLNNKINAQPGADPSSPGISATLNGLGADGLLATINAGFDYQIMPLFVVGIFGDYDFHHLKSDLDLNVSSGPFSAHGEISVNRQWSIGGRMGYLTSPTTLVFVSAGYTNLSLSDFTASISANSPIGTFYASVPTVAGGFVGAGFETKLTKAISLRGEYRFTDFGSGLVTLPTIDGTDLNTFLTARISPTLQIVKASLNFRF